METFLLQQPNPINGAKNKKRTNRPAKKEVNPTAPVFLRKTFELVNSCDPSVASWADDGLTFVVKDTTRFQTDFIPKFFKHNNFSSFVRQLNFYGFHKIRSDPIRLKDAENCEESKYWRFHHDNFRRGRPDLLSEIRKSNHTEAADKQEVEQLRNEVCILRDQLGHTSLELEGLKALVGRVLQEYGGQPLMKKQKVEPMEHLTSAPYSTFPAPTSSGEVYKIQPLDVESEMQPYAPFSHQESSYMPDEQTQMVDNCLDFGGNQVPSMPAATVSTTMERIESTGAASMTSHDEAVLTSLFALDPLEEIKVLESEQPEMVDPMRFNEI
ncbi:heat shock transcription factor, other eukaryote [Fistulifera solaris]|uniref:Heat shock transcription factor, other eukaryote n=1 Tax=Fistulifera solaris TaxID=1519565 RepID=A0A1Z5JKF2_FISSO|nr:heat shock transcription factor, other eukaryote [Fistulifera solaris]|eukprot:GAX14386.1 heat shock transcription factor, other eukaryote [Fistulifera solaris]